MKRSRLVTGKHGMLSLMVALKETEIRAESIPIHIHQGHTSTKQPKYKDGKTTVMVHVGKINETTTLCPPTDEEWRQATSEIYDIRYIKRILSGP